MEYHKSALLVYRFMIARKRDSLAFLLSDYINRLQLKDSKN